MNFITDNDFNINVLCIYEASRDSSWSHKFATNPERDLLYTLNYYKKGVIEYVYNNTSFKMKAPFLFISPQSYEYISRSVEFPTNVISIWFTTNKPLPLDDDFKKNFVIFSDQEDIEQTLTKALFLYNENPQDNLLEYKGLTLNLIGAFFKQVNNMQTDIPSFIYDSLKFINMYRDRTENIKVSDIAKRFNVSYEYYVRQFKKHMGISPKQYINKIKMDYVKGLVRDTKLSMEYISFITGFANKTYFYKAFKEYFGVPPIKFREENKRQND